VFQDIVNLDDEGEQPMQTITTQESSASVKAGTSKTTEVGATDKNAAGKTANSSVPKKQTKSTSYAPQKKNKMGEEITDSAAASDIAGGLDDMLIGACRPAGAEDTTAGRKTGSQNLTPAGAGNKPGCKNNVPTKKTSVGDATGSGAVNTTNVQDTTSAGVGDDAGAINGTAVDADDNAGAKDSASAEDSTSAGANDSKVVSKVTKSEATRERPRRRIAAVKWRDQLLFEREREEMRRICVR
jgi:hypothetical protein